jgi:hypothetical protein
MILSANGIALSAHPKAYWVALRHTFGKGGWVANVALPRETPYDMHRPQYVGHQVSLPPTSSRETSRAITARFDRVASI